MIKQVMIYFGDAESFLQKNDDIEPVLRFKLLAFLSDINKRALLQVELAVTIDWGNIS